MAPWFSASAVAPVLAARWGLGAAGTAWLTISVQLGFVAGALVSAVLTLSDRWSARRVFAGCAGIAGPATAGVAGRPPGGRGCSVPVIAGGGEPGGCPARLEPAARRFP